MAGCVAKRSDEPATRPDAEAAQPAAINETLYLKAAYRLAPFAPTQTNADRVTATPFANGFANEDIRAFSASPVAAQRNLTMARLVVYYEVVGPTLDPFPNSANPQESRQIVFWLGTNRTYPVSLSTPGPTALVPGRVYQAQGEFVLPPAGWIVPHGETIQLLIATLALNAAGYELRFLVDSVSTPSRLELSGQVSAISLPPTLHGRGESFTIPGNGGMFTGATADRVPSRIRTPVLVNAADAYLELRVLWKGNAGGKSDLDFTLFAPDGKRTLLSSTPYQNETIRAFHPQLLALGAGTYTAEIVAYSGVNTRFELHVYFDTAH